MKVESALRWYSIATLAFAGFAIGNFLSEAVGGTAAFQHFPGCESPMVTQRLVPYADSLGILGAIFAVCILTISTVAFYVLRSDPARMRAALIVNVVGWPVLLLASTLFFLAAYVLPMAKCAA